MLLPHTPFCGGNVNGTVNSREGVSHVRIGDHEKDILKGLMREGETSRQVLARILADYDSNGAQRQIAGHCIELELLCKDFIHVEFCAVIEQLKAVLIKMSREPDTIARGDYALVLQEALSDVIDAHIVINRSVEQKTLG